jgi:hypothetical protein
MMTIGTRGVLWGWVLAVFLMGQGWAAESGPWAVKDAPIRFVVELKENPSHPSAGYFVTLPDGGNLPGPFPDPVVFDEAGDLLVSGVLWHCPETGCGLVFQAPRKGTSVVIYVKGGKTPKLWTPASGITPSALLCEINGTAGRLAALKLGELGAVTAKVRFVNQAWSAGTWANTKLPLAIQEWRPGGTAMYLLSYIDVKDPGPVWVAPQSRSGKMDIVIDGKMVAQKKKNEKLGGVGGEVNLTAGLHQVELYGYNPEGGATGPMMFSWRTPKMTVAELGGPRAADLRYPGTAMCESRLIDDRDVVKSGEGEVLEIQSREGGLVAGFTFTPNSVFWFPDETPLVQYSLNAWTKNNPPETVYSWRFDDDPKVLAKGAEINWISKSGTFCGVTLTAELAGKRTSVRLVIYPHKSGGSSMENPQTRKEFRLACYSMLAAYPDKVDPIANWDTSMWNNFFRVVEFQLKNPLLEYLVTHQWAYFRKALEPERKAILEDLFLYSMGERNPEEAMQWALEFSKDAPSHARAVVLQLKRAEIQMYVLGDLEGARKSITPFLADNGEGGEWAKIRMGDLEILARNLNEATRWYGEVQNRSKAGSPEIAAAAVKSTQKPREAALSGPVLVADMRRKQLAKAAANKAPEKQAEVNEAPQPNVAVWKLSAIRDVAASENIGNLIEQGFILESLGALRSWERAFPLSKISGDYLLREAKLYIAVKDYKRARLILTAYCELMDVSNFMGEALKLIRVCMIYMNEPDAAIEKFEKEIQKRMQFGAGA